MGVERAGHQLNGPALLRQHARLRLQHAGAVTQAGLQALCRNVVQQLRAGLAGLLLEALGLNGLQAGHLVSYLAHRVEQQGVVGLDRHVHFGGLAF